MSDGVADSEVFLRGRKLTISALYASDHEVTQGEYEKYCKYGGDEAPSDMCGVGANYPAYYVSWYDAVVYCNLRSKAEGLAPVYKIGSETNPANWPDIVKEGEGASAKYCGPTFENSKWDYVGDSDTDGGVTQDLRANGYRLPTEAEWEYLARDGSALSTNKWSGTNEESELSYYAWYKKDGEQANGGHCYEIAKKKPNGLGLYDMSGNVWEWCWDLCADISVTTPETGFVGESSYRRVRGGSRYTDKYNCSLFYRTSYMFYACHRRYEIGFRVVRTAQ